MSDKETFKQELDARTAEIEQLIGTYLPEETGHQKTIFEAMNYSMKAGGKRLRPMLMQEMCRLFTGTLSGSCDSLYGSCGDDTHLLSGA